MASFDGPRLIDRSRALSYQHCPRERFLGYEYDGRGLAPAAVSVPLATGGTVHLGLEQLLLGKSEDDAVVVALEAYDKLMSEFETFQGIPSETQLYTLAEQKCLVEVLVRVYARRALPKLLAEWDVVGVEKEFEWEVAPGIIVMSRLDGLLRRKDGERELSVLSFKTSSNNNPDMIMSDFKIDMQSITETAAVKRAGLGEPLSVKMEILVKGPWKKDRVEGELAPRRQDSFLVRPWMRMNPTGPEWAWKYYWTCTEPHETTWKNGRKVKCEGNKNHGLGDSFQRVNIWEWMTPKEWVDMLDSGQVQSGDPLESVVYLPLPMTLPAGAERRLDQIKYQEIQIASVASMAQASPAALDMYFRQHTTECNHSYGGKCRFYDICWNAQPQNALDNPFEIGYTYRRPHHEGELIQIGESD